jgi:hypothetical protein
LKSGSTSWAIVWFGWICAGRSLTIGEPMLRIAWRRRLAVWRSRRFRKGSARLMLTLARGMWRDSVMR